GIHQVPAHLAVQTESDTGEVVAERCAGHGSNSPRGGFAQVTLGQKVHAGVTDVEDWFVGKLRVPAHRLVRAGPTMEPFLYVVGLRCRTHHADSELPRMYPAVLSRIDR